MSASISLREAERKAFRLAAFQDGSWDIFLGCCLIIMSFYEVLRSALGPAWNALLLVAAFLLLAIGTYALKRRISAPRSGMVAFRPRRKAKMRRLATLTFILVLATIVFAAYTTGVITGRTGGALPARVRGLGADILFAAIIIGFFSLLAYALGVPRLYLYGWLYGLGNLASTILEVSQGRRFHAPLAVSGGIILFIGVALFIRFLRDYPLPAQET